MEISLEIMHCPTSSCPSLSPVDTLDVITLKWLFSVTMVRRRHMHSLECCRYIYVYLSAMLTTGRMGRNWASNTMTEMMAILPLHACLSIFGRIAKQLQPMHWCCLSVCPSVWYHILVNCVLVWKLLCNPAFKLPSLAVSCWKILMEFEV